MVKWRGKDENREGISNWGEWRDEYKSKRREDRQIAPRLLDKVSKNYFILYLLKFI